MRREIRQYVEYELKNYHETLRTITETTDEIINRTPGMNFDGAGRRGQGKNSNPTEIKAILLLSNRRILCAERTCRAIAKVFDSLPEEKQRYIKLRYWQRGRPLTVEGIAQTIGMDARTAYRWEKGILLAIAQELGLLDA